jgi:co-chaperonin GroES (HSP10)
MRLLGDRIFIKEIKTPPNPNKLIILPKNDNEKNYEVLAVGRKCRLQVGKVIRLYEHTDLIEFDGGYFMNESLGIKAIL